MKKIIKGKDLINMQFVENEDGTLRRYEKKGKFVPKIEQTYWFIDKHGNINDYSYDNDTWDEWILKYNPIFETQEECEEYKNYLLALDKYSYDFSQEDWADESIVKWSLCFDYKIKKIQREFNQTYKCNIYHFKSEDDVEKFIKEVGVEAIEKFMFGVYR